MVQPDHRNHAQSSPPNTELSRDGKTRAAASPSPGSPNRLSPSSAQRERYAWCPTCRRTRPCVRNLGTTDWQTTPVYTCRTCGRVIHEPVPDPAPARPRDRRFATRSEREGSRVTTATSPELEEKR
jgi:hypothetical protein